MNRSRAAALPAYTSIRAYHVEYHGIFGDRSADMVVKVMYRPPDQKKFTILEENGNGWIRNHVFKKLFQVEAKLTSKKTNEHSNIDPENYEFRLVGYERAPGHSCYVLEAKPRRKKKYLFRGKIWVNDQDFAIERIQGEPAKRLSFWIEKSEFEHTYRKFGGFWLPVRDEAASKMRLFGRARLTIQYTDYQLSDLRPAESGGPAPAPQAPASSCGARELFTTHRRWKRTVNRGKQALMGGAAEATPAAGVNIPFGVYKRQQAQISRSRQHPVTLFYTAYAVLILAFALRSRHPIIAVVSFFAGLAIWTLTGLRPSPTGMFSGE